MRVPALGEAAVHLPWLSPSASALVALARSPSAQTWERIRHDPGAVLLLMAGAAASAPSSLSFFPAALHDAEVLDQAIRHLEPGTGGFVDWDQPALRPIYRASLTYAHLARSLAQRTGCCDPDNAWVAGLLAPLGWFAVCALDPNQAAACLADPEFPLQPSLIQQRYWGRDRASIARRLNRRWRLPRWLAAVTGHLDLPVETAQLLGADPNLFQVVQLAVGLAQRAECGLGLRVGATLAQSAADLGMPAGAMEELEQLADDAHSALSTQHSALCTSPVWSDPAGTPLLRELLILAADNRRLVDAPGCQQLESDVDHLQHALGEHRDGAAERLQAQKMSALAEFAAGAGHEINNPLAVISGQAQYLLSSDLEPARQRALQTIIGQAQRIHVILSELMQFARPARPRKELVDVPGLMREVASALGDLAAQRRVVVHCAVPEQPLTVYADPRQVHMALTCLLRNAIEAAPADGWAGVRLETPAPDRLEWVVEDSGGGLTRVQRENLFDPFYSGRPAGRGRGLGLPTAWRLAREHGGEVRFESPPQGPTRFILSLPRESPTNGTYRHSAALEQGSGQRDGQPWLTDSRFSGIYPINT